jgi:hypothetical protein
MTSTGAPSRDHAPVREMFAGAYWLAPPLLCFALYWRGLSVWFQADDFAWLALRLDVHDVPSLLHALFAPMAQGSIRPLSERAFFLVFESLFGVNPLPFRICVFLTQCANLALLSEVTRRLTGSRLAGFCAAILWLVNGGLIVPMTWTSAYNEVLCAFFLLGAFWFLLGYVRSGLTSDYLGQWVMFLVGFGALEVNIVYPALAAAYTLLCRRPYFRVTLPLFAPSAAFAVAHRFASPQLASGVYALHFDRSLPATFLTYWRWALVGSTSPQGFHQTEQSALLAVLALALLGFTVFRAYRCDWLPVFCLAWFAIVLAPLLPLRDHISDYYLVLPTLGLAMLGGYALARAWMQPLRWRLAALALAVVYAVPMVRLDWTVTGWWRNRTLAVERLVLGVVRAHQLHPDKVILLDGVDSAMFWGGMMHHPFRIFGISDVYLVPGSEGYIESGPADGTTVADFVLPSGPALHAAKSDRIVVYHVGAERLKAITSAYEQAAFHRFGPQAPTRIDAGNPLMEYLLGPEWYPSEGGSRWMPGRATLRIGGPHSTSARLYVSGFPQAHPAQSFVSLRVTVDGIALPEVQLNLTGSVFDAALPLPDQVVGKPEVQVLVEVGRTFHTSTDSRELGLNFGTFEIR